MKHFFLSLLLLGGAALSAENLYRWDTGFESGNARFAYYASEAPIKVVKGDAAEGNASLEIDQNIHWPHAKWGYEVKKNTDYTVSFYAKHISGEKKIRVVFLTSDWSCWAGDTFFELTDEWKRYSIRLRVDRDGLPLYPGFLRADENKAAVFRIDALQLEEGSTATSYVPGEKFSMLPSVGPGEVVFTGKVPEMQIPLYNAQLERQKFTVQLTLRGKTVGQQQLELAQGEHQEITLPLPDCALPGYYPLRAEVLDAKKQVVSSCDAPFVVTDPFPPFRQPGFFGIQACAMPNEILPRIGATRLRRNIGGWKHVEVAEGQFEIPDPKWTLPMKMLVTLPTDFLPNTIPAWGYAPGSKKADMKKAAVYLDKLMEVYKKYADTFEIVNEPNLQFRNMPDGAAYYREIMEMAAPLARKHGVKLLVDTMTDPFFDPIWAKPELFDYSAPHPYCVPQMITGDDRYVSPPEQGNFRAEVKRFQKKAAAAGKQLVVGEVGYATGETIGYDSPAAHLYAAYMVRMLLLARACPDCRYFIWYTALDAQQGGPYIYGIWRTDNGIRPLPNVAAYAQAVHEVDFADDIKMLSDGGIKILQYRKNGRLSYAVWNAEEKAVPQPVKLPEGCDIRSIYGEKVDRVMLSAVPFYVTEKGDGSVLAALRSAIASRPPLEISGSLRSRSKLRLVVTNREFKLWKGTLSVKGVVSNRALTLEPGTAETLTLQIPGAALKTSFTVTMTESGGKRFTQKITLPKPLAIPYMKVGNLKTFDYHRYPATAVQDQRIDVYPPDPQIPWKNAGDLSNRTWLGWDEKNFYIFSEVRDDHHENNAPDCDSWAGDSLQFAIDALNNASKPNYESDDSEFTFAMGKKPWGHQAPPTREAPAELQGVRQIITRDEQTKTTFYRIAIPKALVAPLKLQDGTIFGAALCFNDKDPEEARYYMTFGNGLGEAKLPKLFKKMMLVKGKAAQQ